jgi:hypothetical protein
MAQKLVSMKITKADRKAQQEKYATASPVDGDAYPYGLTVRLDNESLEKLGLDVSDYPVGDTVMLIATCEVCETSARQSVVGGENQNLTLQITEMCLEDAPTKKKSSADVAAALYKE